MNNKINYQKKSDLELDCQGDEIDITVIFNTIWTKRYKITIFIFTVFVLTVFYSLSLPNKYKSSTILISLSEDHSSKFSNLASLAGVDMGGGTNEVPIDIQLEIIKNDYTFMKNLVIKNKIYDLVSAENIDRQYEFGLGIRFIYDIKNALTFGKNDKQKEINDDYIYETIKYLKELIKIKSDKKVNTITISATHEISNIAKKIVEIFLYEASSHLRLIEMENTDKKIGFYNEEISKVDDLILKEQLTNLMSSLIQKKVLLRASEFYFLKQLTKPVVSNLKDKTGPARSQIVILGCIAGMFVFIFGIFFFEFIKNNYNTQSIVKAEAEKQFLKNEMHKVESTGDIF